MPRSPYRLVSFVLLVSTLLSLLPVAQPAPAVTAAPLAVEAHDPAPWIHRPTNAGSSALPESEVQRLRNEYGGTQTANGAIDGSYSQHSLFTHTVGGTLDATALVSDTERYRAIDYTVPATPFTHDALTFDYQAVFTNGITGKLASVLLSVWDPTIAPNGGWGEEYAIGGRSFPFEASPSVTLQAQNVHVSLGIVPLRSAVRVRVRCRTTASSAEIGTCQISNLRFSNQVPSWSRAGQPNTSVVINPSRLWQFQVAPTALSAAIPERSDPFLSIKTNSTTGGATSSFRYRSPLIHLPDTASTAQTGVFTASVRYAQHIDPPTTKQVSRTTISFLAVDGVGSIPLITISETTTSVLTWTVKHNNELRTSSFDNKLGWIQIEKSRGDASHVLALDNITLYMDGKPIPLPPDQLLGKCVCKDGGRAQHIVGDPVNTYSGAYYLQATDLSAPSSGPPLTFERSYASLLADPTRYPTTTLGPGWRHAFAEQLVLAEVGSEPRTIIYEAATSNRLRFYVDLQGVPHAAPGVRATLDKVIDPLLQQQVYALRSNDGWLKIFAVTTGRLLERRDPGGHRQVLTYYTAPGQIQDGQLKEVSTLSANGTPTRTLRFTYADHNGPRLVAVEQVPDTPTIEQKRVTFGYTPTGALARVTDLHGGTTEYTYETGSFRLSGVRDPLQRQVVTNTYTNGRVTKQVEHTDLTTTYTYELVGGALTTTVKQWPTSAMAGAPAETLVDHYRSDGTLEYQTRNGVLHSYTTFDTSLAPAVQVDGRGTTTKLVSTSDGRPTTIVQVLSQGSALTTMVRYDAAQRPTTLVAPSGVTTDLTYDARGNLTRSTVRGQDGLQQTAIYTYTLDNRLEAEQQPDGVITTYAYDGRGQLVRTIVNPQPGGFDPNQPDKHLVTEYGYDSFGRLITTTVGVGTSLQRTDTTSYNTDDTIARTIQNYEDGSFDPAHPDEDIITEYGYDQLGRRIFVKDVLGRYDVTSYAPNGQIAQTIRNCRDALGLSVATGCTPFALAYPDRNVVTRYGYDALNRTAFITETGILSGSFDHVTRQFSSTTERTTHLEYDQFSRPVTVTLNYQSGQPNYDPVTGSGRPDVNLQELTYYDGAGNPIWQRDGFGRWTQTEYDALNRPIRTIANYENGNPTTIDPANTGWTNGSDTDLITEQQYRPDGQLARQISNLVDGEFSLNDVTADRITEYQYDALGRPTTTIANVLPGSMRTDTNRATTMTYDLLTGRVQGRQDVLGQWLSYRYDDLSRVTETIQNCRAADGSVHPTNCADATKPNERNVRSQTRYDALGRMVETEDALGHITRTEYDGLGRVVATTVNHVPGAPADADTNVTTRTEYDALGRVIAVIDSTGAITRTEYDDLGRAVAVTDAAGRKTRSGYDASGTQRWMMSHDGRITVSEVDGLGRVITTIANYHNGIIEAADGADRDVITTTAYDAAGRQIETTDAVDRRTAFRYDLRDQLVQVIENHHAECSALPTEQQPCSVITRYTYDRAGNRTAITDARTHTRWMVYDAADRQTQAIDALGRTTTWEYNQRDQPTRKRDPRGSAYDVIFTYDELGRRSGTSATQLDAPIQEQYDALGQRVQMQDGTGTTSFQYDDLGRVTSVQQPGGTVGYSYTSRGERSALRYPSGATVTYSYTVDGQLETVQEGATTLARYAYDGIGRLARVTRANGTLTTYAYDSLDRLFDLTTRVQGDLRSRYQYTLDRAGLRTGVTETFPPTTSGQSVLVQQRADASPVQPSTARILNQFAFVPNQGQTDRRVAFVVRHAGGTVFVTPQGLTLSLPVAAQGQVQPFSYDPAGTDPDLPPTQRQRATPPQRTAVRVEWLQANPRPTLTPDQALPGTVTDLRGSRPATWQRNLPTYGGITYTGLYDGIDLRYDGTSGALKGTYTVAPGADPKQIRWRYAGAKEVRVDGGTLAVTLPAPPNHTAPTLTEAAPIAWQDGPAGRTPVAVSYTIAQDGSVGFALGAYDATRPLTIDPTLSWSATLRGSGSDSAWGVAMANDGTLVLAGATTSADFPQNMGVQPVGHAGGYDAFVTKLSGDGSQVLWQTFLGGTGDDHALGLALDAQRRPVVVGLTTSANLPTTANAVQPTFGGGLCGTPPQPCTDAFLVRLTADGSMLDYGSYLGGNKNDVARRVALAPDGTALLVGETDSATFRTTLGAWQTTPGDAFCIEQAVCRDAFVSRIDPGAADGTQALRWSTRIGGLGADSAWGVAVDSAGEVLVTGVTESANLPRANAYDPQFGGATDAFVTKLSSDGTTARFSTYLGSTANDYGRDVAVDAQGNVYVTGWTYSSLFPTTPGALQPALAGQSDAFVTKLNGDSSALHWSTLVGGSDYDYSFGLAVDSDGTSTLAGWTYSTDLPTYRPLQTNHAGPSGGQDLLLATVTAHGTAAHLVSYLGSSSDDSALDAAAAGSGAVRVTGVTYASTFPNSSTDPSGTTNGLLVALDGLTTPGGEPAIEQRTVSYRYDALHRLTEATETAGTAYRYTYDLVGNRTGVWEDGVPYPTVSYDAANQVAGFSYDAAGNLLHDGTRTLSYDALNRLTSAVVAGTTTYTYSGDGVLASQTTSGVTTSYTQDRVAPLSQVLARTTSGGTTTYRYGQKRLAEVQGSTRTWYGTDALGSVRQTLTDSGTISTPIHYDPWGTSKQGTLPTFGFTGEVQDAQAGLVYLRARWYVSEHGTFSSRDPFVGFDTQPYSLHPYQYGYSNPVLNTDPSGQCLFAGLDTIACVGVWLLGGAGLLATYSSYNACVEGGCEAIEDLAEDFTAPDVETEPESIPLPETLFDIGLEDDNLGGSSAGDPFATEKRIFAICSIVTELIRISAQGDLSAQPQQQDHGPNQKQSESILVVGEGDTFEYTKSLYGLHPNWNITGSKLGNANWGAKQEVISTIGNLTLLDNVDALNLRVGITGAQKYDAIIFNNPHLSAGRDTGSVTAALIQQFIVSARGQLKPGGELHINVTLSLLKEHPEVKQVLGTPRGRFGTSRYYAPYIPRYTTGGPFRFYWDDVNKSQNLLNFVFR